METTLSLPEQVLLLCLDDETGQSHEIGTRHALEGGILAELLLQGRVGVEEDQRLIVVDPTPTGDALLDPVLNRIADQRTPRTLAEWMGKLIPNNLYPSEPVLEAVVSNRLVERGILKRKDDRLLWVIPNPTYPTQNPVPEQTLREQLRAALLGDGAADERMVVLISLLQSAEALDRVLTPEEAQQSEARVKQLCEAAAAGQHTSGAIEHSMSGDRVRSSYQGYSSLWDIVCIVGSFLR